MKDLKIIGREAEAASKELARLGITERNNALNKVADALIKSADYIKEANETDIVNGRKNGMSTALLDRLFTFGCKNRRDGRRTKGACRT